MSKCGKCTYYIRSKMFGNYCGCNNEVKPCELERIERYKKNKAKRRSKYKQPTK